MKLSAGLLAAVLAAYIASESKASESKAVRSFLALQLQLPFQVGLFSFGLVAAAPDGPSDDESGFDPALG